MFRMEVVQQTRKWGTESRLELFDRAVPFDYSDKYEWAAEKEERQ